MIFAREANRADPKLAVPIAGDDPEAVQVAAGPDIASPGSPGGSREEPGKPSDDADVGALTK